MIGQPICIGIIGAGGISEAHMQAIQKEPRAKAMAIADISLETARRQAEKYQISQIYTDYQDMIANEKLDAVIVCVPNFLHAPVVMECLKTGVHVLVEKPMALNSEWAQQMNMIAQSARKVLMVAQNNRFHSEILKLKQLMKQHRFGDVYHAKTGWVRRNGIPGWGSWFTQKELSGGGALIDVGVHVLDLTLWILDYPKPVSVFGQTYDKFGPTKQKLSGWGRVNEQGVYDVEDMAVAIIRFEDGSSLVLDASWASYIEQERVYIELYGTEGGASFDFSTRKLTIYHDHETECTNTTLHLPVQHERVALLSNFIDVIEGKDEAICKPEEGVRIQQILDAIYESARTGELVRF